MRHGARRRGHRRLARLRRRDRLAEGPEHRVRRIRRGLVPRQEYAVGRTGERQERLELRPAAAEQPLGLVRRQVEPVEKRTVALDRCAPVADEEDRAAVLAHGPLAVRQHLVDRPAGVLVALVARHVPHEDGLGPRAADVDEERAPPVLVLVVLVEQGHAGALAPVEAGKPLLEARDLGGRIRERGGERHDLVALGDADVPVAAVERLGPDERRRFGRTPLEFARTGRHAGDRHAIRERQLRERARPATRAVPELHVVREIRVRRDVRVRPVDHVHEQVLAVGRDVDRRDDRRFPERLDLARVRVDEGELTRRVVVEEVLVVLARQRVARLVGAAFALLARRLLDVRAVGLDGRRGRRAGLGRHELHEQGLLVGHPLERAAQHRVQLRVAEAPDLAGRRVADPCLDGVLRGVAEREPPPVGGPRDAVHAAVGRQGHRDLAARGNVDERQGLRAGSDAVAARRVVLAPGPRLDAHAREPQERLGDLRDRRVPDPRHEKDPVTRGTHGRVRRRGRVQHVENVLRRLVVARSRRSRRRHARDEGRKNRDERITQMHDESVARDARHAAGRREPLATRLSATAALERRSSRAHRRPKGRRSSQFPSIKKCRAH